jgi:hypothetical protein
LKTFLTKLSEYLLISNIGNSPIIPGTWGSDEMSAVVFLESASLPSHSMREKERREKGEERREGER